MAEIEHSIRTAGAAVWQHVQNDVEARTSDRHVREVLQQFPGRQIVRILPDEGSDAVGPRPGADQRDTGQGFLVFHRSRFRLGPVHVCAGQQSVLL